MKLARMAFAWLLFAILVSPIGMAQMDGTTAQSAQGLNGRTVDEVYPGLASGAFPQAVLADLPAGVLMKSGDLELTTQSLSGELSQAPPYLRKDLDKNLFFLLEQLATKDLLLKLARQSAKSEDGPTSGSEKELIGAYFDKLTTGTQVSDQEVAEFYEKNKQLCGGASLDQMKDDLKKYVLQQKRQQTAEEHVRTLGQRMPVTVNAEWAREQVGPSRNNPVDQARWSCKPSLVVFSGSSCCGPDKMKPVIAATGKQFGDKVNIVYVEARQEPILAARYRIDSIPQEIFFGKDGKEAGRNSGLLSAEDVAGRL